MGIYDREYYREELENDRGSSWSAVGTIIVLNVAVYVVISGFFQGVEGEVAQRWIVLRASLFQPDRLPALITEGRITSLLTYGFAHADSPWHIIGNMLMLWVVGSDIEGIYGKRLFWKMYLSFIVLSGVCWLVAENLVFHRTYTFAVGASGAVMGVFMLFILHFPRRVLLFFGVLPIPVWLLGLIWLLGDYIGFQGAAQGYRTNVAHAAHLGGALFGWIFYRTHFTLFSVLPTHWLPKLWRRSSRPKMRVYQPEEADEPESLDAEVDRILAKISQHGTESLTQAEIRTLEAASRRAQRRRGARHD